MAEFDITVKNTADVSGITARRWESCFPAADAAADAAGDAALFAHTAEARTLIIGSHGDAAGMCNLVPVSADGMHGLYLFAVGVLPEYRGMGGFRLLCATARRIAESEGADFTVLVPADERLGETYKRYGYRGNISIPRFTVADSRGLLVRAEMPPPVSRRGVLMPSDGFISYIRASYESFRIGDSYLLCGAESGGSRQVYEYIPGCRAEHIIPADPHAHGLILPLTPRAARLTDEASFYCSMGED